MDLRRNRMLPSLPGLQVKARAMAAGWLADG